MTPADKSKEHRQARRYNLALPVSIRAQELKQSVNGHTRDVSSTGIYFTIDSDLRPGSELEFETPLPPEITGGKLVLVRGRCRIVRCDRESEEGRIGVAASIEKFEIVRPQ